jgi:hypothetical protein
MSYTFTAVARHHVTLSVTNPTVTPAGGHLVLLALNGAGNVIDGIMFSTSPEEADFTPTSSGTMTAVIEPETYEATSSFTLTYTEGGT